MSEPTTRQLRTQPMLLVNTGDGKGKTSAAMGVALRAWAQGWDIGVYQFIKSGKWRVGEEKALLALPGGRVTWEHMGTGWTWARPNLPAIPVEVQPRVPSLTAPESEGGEGGAVRACSRSTTQTRPAPGAEAATPEPDRATDHAEHAPAITATAERDPAQAARAGWEHVKGLLAQQRHDVYVLDEFTYVMANGWVSTAEVVDVLVNRPGRQHVVITGRRCPQEIVDVADLVTEMVKVKHPFDRGQRGQAGIEW